VVRDTVSYRIVSVYRSGDSSPGDPS
jgi:hypothetical protein